MKQQSVKMKGTISPIVHEGAQNIKCINVNKMKEIEAIIDFKI